MRLKKNGLLGSLKSRKRSRKLTDRHGMRVERLEDRRLLAFAPLDGVSGLDRYTPPQYQLSEVDEFLSAPIGGAPLQVALGFLRDNASSFGVTPNSFSGTNVAVTDQYTSDLGVTHIYLSQVVNGLEVIGAKANVNVATNGQVVAAASSFVDVEGIGQPATEPTVSATAAYQELASDLGMASSPDILGEEGGPSDATIISDVGVASGPIRAEKAYVPTESGDLELAWQINLPLVHTGHWYDATVSADDGDTLLVSDWVARATYQVFAPPNESPDQGAREIVVDPADPQASPFGWHDVNGLPGADFFDTRGNNADVLEDREGNTLTAGNFPLPSIRPNGGPSLDFRSPLDLTQDPISYTDAATTNAFFWVNYAHDVFFQYGFDEAAGNFQFTNYSGEGLGSDAVLVATQVGDDLGFGQNGGPDFFTPPDGFQPIMRIDTNNLDLSDMVGGVVNTFSPARDWTFDNHTTIHEYGHGVTNRLTGGPSDASGLQAQQSGSLGEGWSEFFGLMLLQNENDQAGDAYPASGYINGPTPISASGLGRLPYSFDMSINPLTFADFNAGADPTCMSAISNCEVHNAGEIWVSALWDLNWILIDKYGFDADIAHGTGGNNLAFQLVMDGLRLQPVNPTFTDARDAILQADLIRNQGVNHKEIWDAFGRRGLGLSADPDITSVFDPANPLVPVENPNSILVSAAFDVPAPVSRVIGSVFSDGNGNGTLDNSEAGLGGITIYIDLNRNGILDPQEPTTLTDAGGNYAFDFLVPGTFTVAAVDAAELTQTTPTAGAGRQVTVSSGQSPAGVDFGLRSTTPETAGVKFHDLNGDGRRELCEIIPGTIQPACEKEPGVPGVWIFADYDNDTRLDIGEPAAKTGLNGEYLLNIDRNGTFFVREVMTPGWTQTFPGGTAQGHRVTVTDGSLNVALDFGNQANLDFGDAPEIYRTTTAAGGPIYPIIDGFHLGASVDADLDGIPSDGADGDDNDQATSDEDGVVFSSIVSPGTSATVDVTVSSGPYSPGRVNGWVDFNSDGDFADSGEHVVVDMRQGTGTKSYSFPVPLGALAGLTYARFTYGFHRFGLSDTPTIRDIAGEVEDYQVRVLGIQPDAIDDQFRVDQNSNANALAVLDNDISSRNGPIFVSAVTDPSRGGRASISADGLTVNYSPAAGFAGVETLTYTLQDQAGATDTALVTLTVVPDTPALAVDDSFDVLENTSNNILDVLSNDLAGQNPPIQILDVVPSNNSLVTVDRQGTTAPGDDVLLYTANQGFAGTDQFSYIIVDDAGIQSTATVTVHNLPSSRNDDIIEYELVTADLTNNPIDAIGVGQPFLLQGYVRDLRADDGDGDPIDRRGIAAAFLDVLYDLSLVSVSGDITFGSDYQNATSGDTSLPGLVNEVGGLQTSSIPLGADRVMLFQIPMVANSAGAAAFRGDPADQRAEANPQIPPDHDSLTFQPPEAIGLQGMRFTNTSLGIVSSNAVPIAVDNAFRVAANSNINNSLDVLANDLDNGNPPLSVVSFTQGTAGGQVQIGPGGSTVLYRPADGFTGVDQFNYTIQNSTGLTASAVVTVQVGDNAKSMSYRLATVPAGPIAVGSTFTLQGFVDDLRADDGDGNARDDRGVFAAYIDVLYDSGLVSVVDDAVNPLGFDVTFSSDYQNGISGSVAPNIIDELGAFQTGAIPLGADELLLFEVELRANAAGVAEFFADPANISPLHDTLLFEPTSPVSVDRISLGMTSVTITGGSPEGEGLTNPANNLDVNDDGEISPIDPLIVVNYLNRAESEGEATSMYPDVTGDGHVSPVDALELINYLNRRGHAEAEGEGEGGAPLQSGPARGELPSQPIATGAPVGSDSSLPPLTSSQAVSPRLASQHESALADWGSDRSSHRTADELDELLSEDLTQDILDGWNK